MISHSKINFYAIYTKPKKKYYKFFHEITTAIKKCDTTTSKMLTCHQQ